MQATVMKLFHFFYSLFPISCQCYTPLIMGVGSLF